MQIINKIPVIKYIHQKYRNIISRIDSLENEIISLQYELNKQRHISKYNNGEKINIVFVCHRPQVWNSLKSLFDCCINDSDFNVTIVAIPIKKQLLNINFNHNIYISEGAEDFWKDSPCNVINGYNYDTGTWFDLTKLKPDYVIFQQPYNIAKSDLYKSSRIAQFASICYTSYYYSITSVDIRDCMPEDFIKNVTLCFLQNNSEYEWFNEKFNYSQYPNVKRFLTGSPRFDNLKKYKDINSPLWKLKRDNAFRIIWTPRWTTNENNCHFFEYKDKFIEYCNTNSDVDFVFRPHPQAKLNYAAENSFSEDDFEKYEYVLKNSNNMNIDYSADFLPLFYSSDVLISDFSSIIPEFFLTGKPIIYCKNEKSTCDIEGKWTSGIYYTKNWNDVKHILEQLKAGNDPLMQTRKQLISTEFFISKEGAGIAMKNLIKKDFRGDL